MAIELTPAGGRYPFGHYDTRNIRARLEVDHGRVLIRIDDIENISRWEELTAEARSVLSALLAAQNSCPECPQDETPLFDQP